MNFKRKYFLKCNICIQNDSLVGGPKLIIINHAIIYQCRDNSLKEDAEIDFRLPGDRGQHCMFANVPSDMACRSFVCNISFKAGTSSVLLSGIYCCQVLFSLVNYCVIYDY
jgi:hypothetical protein